MSLVIFLSPHANQTLLTELKDRWTKTPIHVNDEVTENTNAVLVAIHNSWQEDKWLTDESDAIVTYIAAAMQQGYRIVPIAFNDAELDADTVAPSLAKLVERAGVIVHPNDVFQFADEMQNLVDRLDKFLPNTSKLSTEQTETTPSKKSVSIEKSKRTSVYDPIILPKPRYTQLFIQTALVALILFAILGLSIPPFYNGFYEQWIRPDTDVLFAANPIMYSILSGVMGLFVGWLWRTRLPSAFYMPIIVGFTWGISHYIVVSQLSEPSFLIGLAIFVLPIGHLIAFWQVEYKQWFKFNFKTVFISMGIPLGWLVGFFYSILPATILVLLYNTQVNVIDDFRYPQSRDAVMATAIFFAVVSMSIIATLSCTTLWFLRRIAKTNHPDYLDVIDALKTDRAKNA